MIIWFNKCSVVGANLEAGWGQIGRYCITCITEARVRFTGNDLVFQWKLVLLS